MINEAELRDLAKYAGEPTVSMSTSTSTVGAVRCDPRWMPRSSR
jgi:hypothetical protein